MRRVATILDEILASKREEVRRAKRRIPESALREQCAGMPPARPFAGALAGPGVSVIAEIKRASPSAGHFAPDLDAAAVAKSYEAGGAAAISVLTDGPYFRGSPDDLRAARAATALPVLRKEFIIDPYQIFESRAMGADAVLLIVAAVDCFAALLSLARDVGLECLVEVHDKRELESALAACPTVVGINNRDLRSFVTDLDVTRSLRPKGPAGVLVVSESGVKGPDDVARLREWGVDAVLVGESVVTAVDRREAVRKLVEAGRGR